MILKYQPFLLVFLGKRSVLSSTANLISAQIIRVRRQN